MAEEFCPEDDDAGDFAPVDEAMTNAFNCQCELLGKIRDAIAEGFNRSADVLEGLNRTLAGSLAAQTIEPMGGLSQLQARIRTLVHAEFDALASELLPWLDRVERDTGLAGPEPEPEPPARPTEPEPPETPVSEPPEAPETPQTDTAGIPPLPPIPGITAPTEAEIDQFGTPLPTPSEPFILRSPSGRSEASPGCDAFAYNTAEELNRLFASFESPNQQAADIMAGLPSLGSLFSRTVAFSPLGPFAPVAAAASSAIESFVPDAISSLVSANQCQSASSLTAYLRLSLYEAAAQYISPQIGQLALPLKYALTRFCPTGFPSVSEADAAWFANAITPETHKAWTEINNRCWHPHQAVIEAQRRKLIPGELLQLLLRKKIDEQEFTDGLRAQGYTRERDWQLLRDLGEVYPPYTDQIRLMMRDAYDESRVAELGMDELFQEKFADSERARERAEALGIPIDLMRDLWRAHWSLPATGQLFEQIHRLPFVDDEVIEKINEALRAARSSFTFTRPTQQQAINNAAAMMIQNDILPSQIPGLMALSFRRMRIRDISRAFQIGVISKPQLIDLFKEQGYTSRNANIQADFWEANTDEGADSDEGIQLFKKELMNRTEASLRMQRRNYTPERIEQVLDDAAQTYRDSDTVKRFEQGRINRATAMERLAEFGIERDDAERFLNLAAEKRDNHPALEEYEAGVIERAEAVREIGLELRPAERVEKLLDEIDRKLEKQLLKECAANLCGRFASGEFQEHDLRRELTALGLAPSRVTWWIERCKCKRKSAGKKPSASQLCTEFERGLLAPDEFSTQLLNQGWSVADAARIIESCSIRVEAKLAKEAEREAKRIAKEAADREKELLKRRKAAARDAEKLVKAREAAAKARDQREARIVVVIDKLATALEIALPEATRMVRNAWRKLTSDFPFTPNERVKILETAVHDKLWTDGLPWDARWRAVAAAALEVATGERGQRNGKSAASEPQ